MKTCIKLLAIAIFTTGLFGCAYPKMNYSKPINQAPAVQADKALVYFLRTDSKGYKIHAVVYDGEEFIGMVPYNQKLPYMATPGEHTFMVVSEAADFMKADLLPGKTYYVEVVPRMGMWRARFSLKPVTQEKLESKRVRKRINKSRLIENIDLAYVWAKNNHNSVLSKKAEYYPKWQKRDDEDKPYLRPTDGE